MSSLDSGSNSSGAKVGEKTAQQRSSYITGKDGDAIGHNWTIPKADFAKFLGYKPATPDELSGKAQVSGHRVLEIAMQKEMQEIGEGAAKDGPAFRNMYVASSKFANTPGRDADAIKETVDAIRQGPEKNSTESLNLHMGSAATEQYFSQVQKMQTQTHNDNVRYLELQYKLQEMSKQTGAISNLMKTRHDSVSRVIRGGSG